MAGVSETTQDPASGAPGSEDFVAIQPRHEPGFDHVVVLMGENRSFDNQLGWLYTPENLPEGQSFKGLAFGEYTNVAPDGTVIEAHVYEGDTDSIMGQPNPDPGEEFPHVNTQQFGTIDPRAMSTSGWSTWNHRTTRRRLGRHRTHTAAGTRSGSVRSRRRERHPAGVCVHRAPYGLQPQRPPPPPFGALREESTWPSSTRDLKWDRTR